MSVSDQIANAIIKIQNAVRANLETATVPKIKILGEILRVLKKDGFIEDYVLEMEEDVAKARYLVTLRYTADGESVIHGVKRISKPSRRVYAGYDSIPSIFNNYGRLIISSSEGVLTDAEARRRKIGGELLFSVW